MLYTNLKIAFRNLLKFKTYSFINISGLALGMAVAVLIMMFVVHEFSYDRFHSNHQRIYQVFSDLKIGENSMQLNGFSADFGSSVKLQNPHVKAVVRSMSAHNKIVISNPEKPREMFYEKDFLYADPSFFKVFSFKLKQGDAAQVLGNPTSLVISEQAARKYFGDSDPVGKVLKIQNKHLLEVTGVAENVPSNSSITFDFLVPVDAFPIINEIDRSKWLAGGNFNIFLLLDSPEAAAPVAKTINAKMKKQEEGVTETYKLHSLASIHLGNDFDAEGNSRLIYIFAGIAVLILALALFNYMSLTTARATLRAKEVGVRKVIGSGRGALVRQFYTESALICSMAFVFALLLVEMLRHPFNELLGLTIDTAFLYSPGFLGFVALLFFAAAFIAGSYPALVLSGFAPLEILKGRFFGNQKGAAVRKTFMVFQFAVSIALIMCSLVVKSQVSFMQNMKLGFNKDQVLAIPFSESSFSEVSAVRDEIARQAGVKGASLTSGGFFGSYNITFEKNKQTKKDVALIYFMVDKHFVNTLGLQWKLAPEPGTMQNRKYVLLNEVAVKELGIQKNPLGSNISMFDKVAGVLKNFHFSSPQSGIKPAALLVQTDTTSFGESIGSSGIIYARLDPNSDIKRNVEAAKKLYASYYPDRPFEYYFLDEAFNKNFQTEIRMSKIFTVFTGLAIFIACMGLFGLVTFTAETRFKEIGIRKVLGASVGSIVGMLSADFLKLILIAIITALPIAWYFMNKWLQNFTYRIDIPVWIYVTASVSAVLIALVTISFQSVKAALMNPVKSLRSD